MDEITHKKSKIYYSIGEVAEMFDVNASLIRFWEKKFDIIKPHKNNKGNRMFTPKDVDNFKLIYHLVKERGMTLAGAQQRLKNNKSGESHNMEIVDRLLSIRSMLVEIREELKQDGETFTPEGYLDEDYAEYTTTIATSATVGLTESSDKYSDDELVIITEEVRTDVVTDGSSPWNEADLEELIDTTEEELIDDAEEELSVDENAEEEPVNETQRDAAMEELRSVKDILAGWNTLDNEVAQEDAPEQTNVLQINPNVATQVIQANDLDDLGNIFDDELDENYTDPWDKVQDKADEEPASENAPKTFTNTIHSSAEVPDPFSNAMKPLASAHTSASATELSTEMASHAFTTPTEPSDEHASASFANIPEAGRPKPGDVFGTDACTTFSPDDSEINKITAGGEYQEHSEYGEYADPWEPEDNEAPEESWEREVPEETEEPKRPTIYEQTLF